MSAALKHAATCDRRHADDAVAARPLLLVALYSSALLQFRSPWCSGYIYPVPRSGPHALCKLLVVLSCMTLHADKLTG